jgi:hypothetical protein
MADNLSNRNRPDNARINVNQDHELRHWSEKFKVTPERLKEAVRQVGPMAKDVEQHLTSNK